MSKRTSQPSPNATPWTSSYLLQARRIFARRASSSSSVRLWYMSGLLPQSFEPLVPADANLAERVTSTDLVDQVDCEVKKACW